MNKIAIHHHSGTFSERWVAYCDKHQIPYKIVNAFDSDLIEQLQDSDVFMWHHHHADFKDVVAAKKILFALEHAGINVFPSFNTGWHFDDKVAQKYLLEAINAPMVPSYVFYDKQEALKWSQQTTYPKVFKLKGGAGASNVQLVRSQADAAKLIKKAFGKGFPQFDRMNYLMERINKFKDGQISLLAALKSCGRLIIPRDFAKKQANEKGYVYFQDFMPDNDSDLRVVVIGDKAFAIKRMVRDNDFRASGSGQIVFDPKQIDEHVIKLAFDVNQKLGSQAVAYDFVYDEHQQPLIIEISYGFAMKPYDACPGYWDKDLNWHEGTFNPQAWMIENIRKRDH